MNLDYFPRGLVIALATYFFAQAACNLAAGWTANWLAARTRAWPARRAARSLLLYRMLPGAAALALWGWFCLPGYWSWEPRIREHTSGLALLAAAAGLAWVLAPAARAGRAIWQTARLLRQSRRCGSRLAVQSETAPVLQIQSRYPLLALAGSWRPRVLISAAVIEALTREELGAALRHEAAHRGARDNLKRLLLLLLPPAWPGGRGARKLEQEWARQTEWAADDEAAGNDGAGRLPLASALLQLARLQQAAHGSSETGGLPGLCFSLTGADTRLSERVNRLLEAPALAPAPPSRKLRGAAAIGMAGLAMGLAYLPMLHGIHILLEALIR